MTANSLDSLIHDINSKCASLKGAAVLLRRGNPKEAKQLLPLMIKQARALARQLEKFKIISPREEIKK